MRTRSDDTSVVMPRNGYVAEWRAEATTIREMYAALSRLHQGDKWTAFRTSLYTFVILTEDRFEAQKALDVATRFSKRHPSRTVTITRGSHLNAPRVDAVLRLHEAHRGDISVCFDDVSLFVEGPLVGHLDSVIEPLTIADVQVILWLPHTMPSLNDPLLATASLVVVDSSALGDCACFPELVELTQYARVTDLAWQRLTPWRELFAQLFDSRDARSFLDGIRNVRVRGKRGSKELIGGWMTSRLNLPNSAVTLEEHDHVAIELEAESEGRTGWFSVVTTERTAQEHVVGASIAIEGGARHDRTVVIPDRPVEDWVSQAVSTTSNDDAYKAAVAAAVELMSQR
jgi:glucose-6-phosphate dehydrogenase assembly protein OpcA